MKLVAIDFETADRSADSACAIGIVSIEKGKITKKGYRLIRPPRRHFVFSYIHGISWADVEAQPTFNEVWDHFASFWKDADYFLAHNAPFDRNVLTACCAAAGRKPPRVPFICTVRVARSHWKFRPPDPGREIASRPKHLRICRRRHDRGRPQNPGMVSTRQLTSLEGYWGTTWA